MKKIVSLVLFVFSATFVFGQYETIKKTARPSIPGSFMIDLGVNQAIKAPSTWDQGWWGSRTVNFYYQYSMRFGRSKFSLNPGIGLSLERWKFVNGATLIDTVELDSYPGGPPALEQVEQYNLLSPARIYPSLADKSMLVANYVEIPIDIRFDTKPEDISRSFNVALGGRIGYLYDSFRKVKFEDKGETIKDKYKSPLGLNRLRYGIYARIGLGSFSLFSFYNLSNMFEKGKGPLGADFNTMTYGISINGF
ncbi:MAG: outer membrane beta-barrel protein [Cyclobacteriaceae bacterium]|nr:outer membrane beta-barrel protein [Cyclobacteriaceae bacterium]